jgi:hypothetical protein
MQGTHPGIFSEVAILSPSGDIIKSFNVNNRQTSTYDRCPAKRQRTKDNKT